MVNIIWDDRGEDKEYFDSNYVTYNYFDVEI